MSEGIAAVTAFLKTLEFERTPYAKTSLTISDLKSNFEDGDDHKFDHYKKKSLFGFVPTFNSAGQVDIYIRMGGPEIIEKTRGSLSSSSLSTFYGRNTTKLKLHKVSGDTGMTYHPDSAPERDLLQRHLLKVKGGHRGVSWSSPQVAKLYPFRLRYDSEKGLKLQYAKDPNHDHYSDITDYVLGAFVADIMLSTITSNVYSNQETQSPKLQQAVLDLARGTNADDNMDTILSYVFFKMAEDLKDAVDVNIGSYLDMTYPSGNRFDHLFYYAFSQLLNPLIPDITVANGNYQKVRSKAQDVVANLSTIANRANDEEVADAVNFYFASFVSNASLEAVAQDKVAAANLLTTQKEEANTKLQLQIDTLKTKNQTLRKESKGLVSPKTYRNVGMVAGLISSYMAVTQESAKDMDLWKKALIIAGGTGLGAIPYVSFLSIATMPYLVDKGIELSGDEEFKARTRERLTRAKDATVTAGRNLATAGRSARDRLRQRRLGQGGIMEAEVVDVVEPLALPAPEDS